jgi:hypothetical protein
VHPLGTAAGLHKEQGELHAVEEISHSLRAERDSMQRKLQAITETVLMESAELSRREAGGARRRAPSAQHAAQLAPPAQLHADDSPACANRLLAAPAPAAAAPLAPCWPAADRCACLPPYAACAEQEATARRTLGAMDHLLQIFQRSLGLRFITSGSRQLRRPACAPGASTWAAQLAPWLGLAATPAASRPKRAFVRHSMMARAAPQRFALGQGPLQRRQQQQQPTPAAAPLARAGNLQLVLTHIDPADPAREFSFSVRLQPDESYLGERRAAALCRRWRPGAARCRRAMQPPPAARAAPAHPSEVCQWSCTSLGSPTSSQRKRKRRDRRLTAAAHPVACATPAVTSCEPEVPHLAQLEAQLNASGDFSSFVKGVRAEFRKAALAAQV